MIKQYIETHGPQKFSIDVCLQTGQENGMIMNKLEFLTKLNLPLRNIVLILKGKSRTWFDQSKHLLSDVTFLKTLPGKLKADWLSEQKIYRWAGNFFKPGPDEYTQFEFLMLERVELIKVGVCSNYWQKLLDCILFVPSINFTMLEVVSLYFRSSMLDYLVRFLARKLTPQKLEVKIFCETLEFPDPEIKTIGNPSLKMRLTSF